MKNNDNEKKNYLEADSADRQPRVHWIDDRYGQIYDIAAGAISVLWDNNIISEVYLFGDASWQTGSIMGPSAESEKNLNKKLTQIFRETCAEIDRENWLEDGTTYLKRKELILIDTQTEADLAKIGHVVPNFPNNPEKEKRIRNTMEAWSDPEKLKLLSSGEKATEENDLGIDHLMEQLNIDKKDIVALDVCLLRNDADNIIHKGLPAISMAIYNWCRQNKLRCYVYSRYSYDDSLISEWKKICNSIFKIEEIIHPENNLKRNDPNNSDIIELLSLLQG